MGITDNYMKQEARLKLLELQLYELDSGKDFEVQVSAKVGGVLFHYSTTVDKIRNFFTGRREKTAAKP